MSSAQLLPIEILENVFRLVLEPSNRKPYLLDCALVCQSWHLPACRIMYEKIAVFNRARMIHCFSLHRNNLGVFCREIELNDGRDLIFDLSCVQYDQLFSYLPNLQRVIVGNHNALMDLRHLVRNNTRIKHLKELTIAHTIYYPHLAQAYYNCVSAFKQTLQHINLTDLETHITANNGQNQPIYMSLPEITALTSIDINSTHYRGIRQLSMFRILHLCPNLTKFIWINGYQEHITDENNCEFDHSKLKNLEISLPTMTKEILYIICKKMTGLTRLRLSFGFHTRRPRTREVFNLDQLLYLRYNLSHIDTIDYIVSDHFKTTITDYWSFVDSINGTNSSQPTQISMILENTGYSTSGTIKLCKRGKYTSFCCRIDMGELASWKSSIARSPSYISSLSSKETIQRYEFDCRPIYDQQEDWIDELRMNVLPFALETFPNIRFFNMILHTYPKHQIEVSSNKEDYHQGSSYTMSKLPMIVTPSNSTDNSRHLAYLKLRNIQSPVEINSILKLLPNTKHLTLFNSFKELDENFNFTLDLGAFHLKALHLELTKLAMSCSGKRTIILQIEEESINKKHCYKWKREDKKFTEIIFEPVPVDFSTKYGRFGSKNCNILTIKLSRVEEIVVSFRRFYLDEPKQSLVNLTSSQ